MTGSAVRPRESITVYTNRLLHAELADRFRFNAGVFNLTDEKYWEWSDVRGLSPASTTLDRYTAPGINFGASVTMQF